MFNATLSVAEDVNHLPRREFGRDGKAFAQKNFIRFLPNNAIGRASVEDLGPRDCLAVTTGEVQRTDTSDMHSHFFHLLSQNFKNKIKIDTPRLVAVGCQNKSAKLLQWHKTAIFRKFRANKVKIKPIFKDEPRHID